MNRNPWNYFLVLERDFMRVLDFVELAEPNFGTYSNELAKLLLLACSEVDVVAKMLCAQTLEPGPMGNIKDYQKCLTEAFVGVHGAQVTISRYDLLYTPWAAWEQAETSPIWWKAHNKVKHGRDANFAKANLDNVANALAALLILLRYFYRKDGALEPYPILFECGFPQHIVARATYTLPGLAQGPHGDSFAPWDLPPKQQKN